MTPANPTTEKVTIGAAAPYAVRPHADLHALVQPVRWHSPGQSRSGLDPEHVGAGRSVARRR